MSIRITITAIAAAFAIPAMAAAEMSSGAVTLGYGSGEAAGFRAHELSFDGVVSANLGNNMSLNARANAMRAKENGFPGHADAYLVGLGLAYSLGNGGWAGAYLENGSVGDSSFSGKIGYTQLGLEGGFKVGGADVAGFIGRADDIDSIGISAKFSPGSNYQIGGGLIHSRIDSGFGKESANYFGLAGTVNVARSVNMFGGVAHTTLSGLDVTTFGLGASYDLGASLGGSSVSLELGRVNVGVPGGSGHMNTVRLGLTVPLGRGSSAVPQNSVAGAVLNPTKNTVSQAILSGF